LNAMLMSPEVLEVYLNLRSRVDTTGLSMPVKKRHKTSKYITSWGRFNQMVHQMCLPATRHELRKETKIRIT
jgi:hypothetical protein